MNYGITLAFILTLTISLSAQEKGKAPDFTLQDIDGKMVKLSDYLGKQLILIDFWATWCNPCKAELPHLDAIFKQHQYQGMVFFAISEDSPRSISKVKPYVRSKDFAARVLLDPDGQVLRKFFAENTLPYTVIIDRSGKIAKTYTGYVPGQETEIAKFIEGMVQPAPLPEQ